ncbi:MAG: DUF6134 family protein [Paracoccaceae bacterium]
MENNLNRRTFLFTASAVLSAPSLVLSSQTFEAEASREFLVKWRNMTIGSSNVRVRRDEKKLRTEIDVNLVLKIFGITFYSYSLKNRELWEEGQLIKLTSEAQENKKKDQLSVHKKANNLHIEGSKFTGEISENVATTSYFTSDFLLRKLWINTHNGKPLNVDFMASGEKNISTFSGERIAKKWVNSGDLDLSLFYDANGDWIGSSFPVRGEQATMILNKEKNSINGLWKKTLSQ